MHIGNVPERFTAFVSADFTTVQLNGQNLAKVPDWIRTLTGLITLDLEGNQLLTALPDWIGELTALTELHLYGNRLTALPDTLGNLTALTELHLEDNGLTALPDTLGNLTALTTLRLEDNGLTALPIALADLLTGGLNLRLADNPLADPLSQLAKHGANTLAAYLRSLTDAKPHYEAKLLLVGEGNVGKSSLLAALRGDAFIEERPTTHGIEIWPLTFPHPALDEVMTLRSWDFGGQIVYRVTHQFFTAAALST